MKGDSNMGSNLFRFTLPRPSFQARPVRLLILLVSLFALTSGIWAQQILSKGDGRRFYPDDPLWEDSDTMDIAEPVEFQLYEDADFLINSFKHPGGPAGPSLNTNTLDEVPNSSWFTNRIGRQEMTIEEIARGPDTFDGPAPGRWTITGRPGSGITPKFTIRDSRGDTYLFKLDPLHLPELPSSAEIISSKIFHTLGYNVGEDFVVQVDRSQLDIDSAAMWRDDRGKKRNIVQTDVDHWLKELAKASPDGMIRVLAHKYIEGTPKGPYRYHGTRSDDPNDLYPHERRRELRALRVFAAWLHHDDSRSTNTFNTYVEEDGRGFIRHYLLDFGSNLGSSSNKIQEPRIGYEYYVEGDKVLKGIFSFGLWRRGWMKVKYADYPAVGNFESDFFEPWKWKPGFPNPAFDRMDEADAFWAASLLSRFTDEMIRAIVGRAEISDPEAEGFLIDALIKRRDKCVNYWISRTNPLDRFEVNGSGQEVIFDNAAARVGTAQPGGTYKVQWSALDNLKNEEQRVGGEIEVDEMRLAVPQSAWGPKDDVNYRYAVARIRTFHPDYPHWQEPLVLTLRDKGEKYDVVGIERPRKNAKVKMKKKGKNTDQK